MIEQRSRPAFRGQKTSKGLIYGVTVEVKSGEGNLTGFATYQALTRSYGKNHLAEARILRTNEVTAEIDLAQRTCLARAEDPMRFTNPTLRAA